MLKSYWLVVVVGGGFELGWTGLGSGLGLGGLRTKGLGTGLDNIDL